ncbi:MAG: hypothetical protein ACRBBK_06930 [Paracoccaceae bacterium]
MKPEENKTLQAVDAAVDEVIGDGQKARDLKKALHDRLDPELHETGKKARDISSGDETDLFDNMPV